MYFSGDEYSWKLPLTYLLPSTKHLFGFCGGGGVILVLLLFNFVCLFIYKINFSGSFVRSSNILLKPYGFLFLAFCVSGFLSFYCLCGMFKMSIPSQCLLWLHKLNTLKEVIHFQECGPMVLSTLSQQHSIKMCHCASFNKELDGQ